MTSLPSDGRYCRHGDYRDECQRCGNELRDDEYRYCDWCQLTTDEEE